MKQRIIPAMTVAFTLMGFVPAHGAEAKNLTSKPALPQALSISDLASLSGGTSPSGIAITKQSLTAVNSGNTLNADSITTGDVSIGAGAFNGFNGVGNFVFNTGNNNNVQGSLSVTIITPAN